ncbi:hypothetical protein [Salinimonas chungwhensis]|uniref:hypothetical protein n=1 Tax=Salinimonas chungwhensis TaxID=265425 RepID=UPI000373C8F4|nr:hypothetical protein [Salinimonas chungwhensis]
MKYAITVMLLILAFIGGYFTGTLSTASDATDALQLQHQRQTSAQAPADSQPAESTITNKDEDATSSPVPPRAQQELEQWLTNHRRVLKASMQEKLGDHAGSMYEKVVNDNLLLDSPVAENSLEQDLMWRRQTEQQLRAAVAALNSDQTLQIESTACIQNHCELIMTGAAMQAASVLYIRLITKAEAFGLSEAAQPVFHIFENGGYWVYVHLRFSIQTAR